MEGRALRKFRRAFARIAEPGTNVRLHRWGVSDHIDQSLMSDGEVDCHAYVRKDLSDEVVWLVDVFGPRGLIAVLNHENLHIVLTRLGLRKENNSLDRVSSTEEWILRGNVGGL